MYESNQHIRSQSVENSIRHLLWRCGLRVSLFALLVSWLALSSQARAVCREGCNGNFNTFLGDDAFLNRTGHLDTAIGAEALRFETVSNSNTATGAYALYNNTGANNANGNTATGVNALYSNTISRGNTATGVNTLYSNMNGNRNVADGCDALFSNQSGEFNTAIGFRSLYQNTGSNNVGLGFNAGSNLTTGDGNICIGYNVVGVAGESNTTRISNIYSSAASARLVYITSGGKIGTLVSSQRFKQEIKSMDNAGEAILALKPVTFRYKEDVDSNRTIMFGLMAEDVEKVNPDLVTYNDKGEAESVRYEAVNAILLDQFLKQHRRVEGQEHKLQEQERIIEKHQAEIRALASEIQKVSAYVEARKPALRVVSNNQ